MGTPPPRFGDLFGGTDAEEARVVGIDLTGSEARGSGWCFLNGSRAETAVLSADDEILDETIRARPHLVSIDSPLCLPLGRTSVDDADPGRNEFGIMRESERELKGTDQNAVIHLYTHELGLSRGTQCSGSGGVQVTRGRGSARGLVQCRRGRTAEQREPVVDPLSGQALASTGPLVPSPAPRAQIEPGTEQVEKALGCTFVHIEIGA